MKTTKTVTEQIGTIEGFVVEFRSAVSGRSCGPRPIGSHSGHREEKRIARAISGETAWYQGQAVQAFRMWSEAHDGPD